LKVVITNWPEGKVDELDAVNNPEDESAGKRKVPFSGEFYIEREDFHENPPKKYFRLGPEREVRLRYGYFVKYESHVKNDEGEVTEVHCTYDPETRGGNAPPDGRKVRGTIHWVSAAHAVDVEARLYDHLFATPNPSKVPEGGSWRDNLNPNSLETITAKVEPALAQVQPGDRVQFERRGYFCADIIDSKPGAPVFNRTVTLRDSWARIEKRGK
jgi:glutaminyl-tRNA synthetase